MAQSQKLPAFILKYLGPTAENDGKFDFQSAHTEQTAFYDPLIPVESMETRGTMVHFPKQAHRDFRDPHGADDFLFRQSQSLQVPVALRHLAQKRQTGQHIHPQIGIFPRVIERHKLGQIRVPVFRVCQGGAQQRQQPGQRLLVCHG